MHPASVVVPQIENSTAAPAPESVPAVQPLISPTAGLDVLLPPNRPTPMYDPALPPVLVVEDDLDDAYFIDRFIKKTGVKNPVKLFDDGTEVVNFLTSIRRSEGPVKHRPPLLLFLDLNMKGLGGFQFLEWARDHQKELAPLTIVVLTNSVCPEDMARAHELGAHRYLVKYPSVQTFNAIVRGVYPQTVF